MKDLADEVLVESDDTVVIDGFKCARGKCRYDRSEEFKSYNMTPERAQRVRDLKYADRRPTWRRIAEICHEEWPEADWGPPNDNQMIGKDICEAAAWYFGEDPSDEPWN